MVVAGNRDALKQVLLILLDNALKYTPSAGTVSIHANAQAERVTIAVRDTGVGIAPAVLPHIFERFYRGDAARSGEGAGLGLAIAKTLIEVQHGTIVVESLPGQGTSRDPHAPTGGAPHARRPRARDGRLARVQGSGIRGRASTGRNACVHP